MVNLAISFYDGADFEYYTSEEKVWLTWRGLSRGFADSYMVTPA